MKRARVAVAAALTVVLVGSVPAVGSAAPDAVVGGGAAVGAAPLSGPLSTIADARLITLRTRDSNERPRTIDASLFVPKTRWAGPGKRPLIGMAVGTYGQGDRCAPSVGFRNPVSVDGGGMQLAYENTSAAQLLARGYAVVVPDYIGLGRPGMHTYLNRTDQGRAVIDAVRAARKVGGLTGPVAFWGYSQGGYSAAAAAELVPDYAPELPVRAVYAGAPPRDLSETMRYSARGVMWAISGWTVNGAIASQPQIRDDVLAVLNDEGRRHLRQVAEMCMPDAVAFGMLPRRTLTRDGRPLVDALFSVPGFKRWADAQRIGTVAPRMPVLVHAGRNDDVVPYGGAVRLVRAGVPRCRR